MITTASLTTVDGETIIAAINKSLKGHYVLAGGQPIYEVISFQGEDLHVYVRTKPPSKAGHFVVEVVLVGDLNPLPTNIFVVLTPKRDRKNVQYCKIEDGRATVTVRTHEPLEMVVVEGDD